MELANKLAELATAHGATNTCIIDVADIKTSLDFRAICATNACGVYGRCWQCPPYIGEAQDLIDKLYTYKTAVIYQTIAQIEDSFDFEGMIDAGRNHSAMSLKINAELKKQGIDCLHLSKGGCGACKRCAVLDDKPCIKPEDALCSLEGYCIDVYNTVKPTKLKYINGANTVKVICPD